MARISNYITPVFGCGVKVRENRKTCDSHLFLILLKSNYDRTVLRLRNSASFPISADSLFVPF
jgi:shikimate kinase